MYICLVLRTYKALRAGLEHIGQSPAANAIWCI